MKISIVTPSFNQAPYLPAMLDSIKKQTLPPHEHLIFDAGSSDGSLAILEKYCQSSKFASLRVGKDRGPADAIDKGLAAATGDVLAWLNTDDGYCGKDTLKTVSRLFEKHPEVDVVYGRGRYILPDGASRPAWIHSDAGDLKNKLIYSIGIMQPTVFFRKRASQEIGPLDLLFSYAFDYDYWIRMAIAGRKFLFVDKELAYATLHDSNITTRLRVTQLEQTVEIVRKHFGFSSSEWIEKLVLRRHYELDSLYHRKDDGTVRGSIKFDNLLNDLFRNYNRSSEAVSTIVSSGFRKSNRATRQRLAQCGLIEKNHIILTLFDKKFFDSGLTLIAGVHRYTGKNIPVFVYDYGLSLGQRDKLRNFANVFVLDCPKNLNPFYDNNLNLTSYVGKCVAMSDIKNYVEKGTCILWCDAGVAPLQSLVPAFNIVSKEEILFIDHDDATSWPLYNIEFTHPKALELLSATAKEMLADHLRTSLMGYKSGGRFESLFDEAYAYSQNLQIILYGKHPSKEDDIVLSRAASHPQPKQVAELRRLKQSRHTTKAYTALSQHFPYWGHRQDQSVFSILAARYNVMLHSARHFCRSNDQSSKASKASWRGDKIVASRDLPQDMDASAVTYHHRRTYIDHDGLQFNCRTSDTLVVLGNGSSMKGFDFARLDGFDTIGMNAAYRYWERIDWYPRYYICLDTVVGLSHREAIARLIRESDSNGIRYFILLRNLVDSAPELKDHPRVLVFDDMQKSFSVLSPGGPITTGSHAALMGAVFGYRKIYLLGVDCNYVERVAGSKEVEKYVLEIADDAGENPNYFFADYQRKGDRYHVPNSSSPDLHLRSWQIAGRRLEDASIAVINANRHSKLDTFPFCDVEDIEFTLTGPYRHSEQAHIDEAELVARFFAASPIEPVMVDVGAHHGGTASRFLRRGWKVIAFEPDAANRNQLLKSLGSHPMITIDSRALGSEPADDKPFFTSEESTGISGLSSFHETHKQTATVSVTDLRHAVKKYQLSKIDFLKIDTEGYDLMVLKGLPWEDLQPQIVLCEFEDRKTQPLGYSTHDLAAFLIAKGYTIFVSEWHPIVRYGRKHDWRRLALYPCQLEHPQAWGNLIAFRDAPNNGTLRAIAQEVVELASTAKVPMPSPRDSASPAQPAARTDRSTGARIRSRLAALLHRVARRLFYAVPLPSALRHRLLHRYHRFMARRSSDRILPRRAPAVPGFAIRLARIARNRHALSFMARRFASLTAAVLFAALASIGVATAGIAGDAENVWLTAAGLALVGLVVMKEAVLWRWRRKQSEAALAKTLASERKASAATLSEAIARTVEAERARAGTTLTRALAAERKASATALSEAIAKTVAAERARAETTLTRALASERKASAAALSEAIAKTVAAERARAETTLTKALATERSERSLVDAHLADRGLPLRRILLLFTIHRSGSTWLFDMLRTHPAIRVEPTARAWTALGFDGGHHGRYPVAFHHADGAVMPIEVMPGRGAAIATFPHAAVPGTPHIQEADLWALEKAHPQFVGFKAGRLAARLRDLRESGVEVEIVYGLRNPLDAMWSMAEYKQRNPEWYRMLTVADLPRFIANSLEVLVELRDLFGGTVIEYESLPASAALKRLGCRLASSWGEDQARAWLAHAALVTGRAVRTQRPGAGFFGTPTRLRNRAGPDGAWRDAAPAAAIAAARDAHRRLTGGETEEPHTTQEETT